jgi:hypothetical protein
MINIKAKEFLKNSNLEKVFKSGPPSIETIMIEFAKIKVTEALQAASEKAEVYADEGGYSEFVDKDSILNAYDLESIV